MNSSTVAGRKIFVEVILLRRVTRTIIIKPLIIHEVIMFIVVSLNVDWLMKGSAASSKNIPSQIFFVFFVLFNIFFFCFQGTIIVHC